MNRYRLLSWNVNGRTRLLSQQVTAIFLRAADVVCLQEVTAATIPRLRPLFDATGLSHIVDSRTHFPEWEPAGPRRYGLLIASRFPVAFVANEAAAVWPERILTARVALPDAPLLVTTAHVPPGSSNGWKKVEMLEALVQVLAEHPDELRIACGDLNTPQLELPSGEVVTWAQRLRPGGLRLRQRIRNGSGERWDTAERTVLTATALRDAFRSTHGYAVQEFSWVLRRQGREVHRRFDHAFCSAQIQVRTCQYLHPLREAGLSDHSPLEMTFSIA